MCISNTPDTQVQEDHLLHNHHCHEEKGLNRTVLRLLDPSKSDTHDKPTSSSNSVVNQQQQREQQQVGQSSSSPPTTVAESASEVSSISSTTKPHRTIPAFILRKQAKMHVPTMIVVRMNDAAQQQLDLGISTNDAHIVDENDATTPPAAAATITATVVSDAISTFSSWVQPDSETKSSNDDTTSTSSSSNGVLSTFSSWVRPDSRNDNC